MMFCMRCQNDLVDCTCPDVDERLAKLSNEPEFAFKMCAKCKKHHNRCKCEEPEFVSSDKEVKYGVVKAPVSPGSDKIN